MKNEEKADGLFTDPVCLLWVAFVHSVLLSLYFLNLLGHATWHGSSLIWDQTRSGSAES